MDSSHSSEEWENIPTPLTPIDFPSSPSSEDGNDDVSTPSAASTATPSAVVSVPVHVVSPYTPAPSPQPFLSSHPVQPLPPYPPPILCPQPLNEEDDPQSDLLHAMRSTFHHLTPRNRIRALADLLSLCDNPQLVYISNLIAPRLKRDFLRELPVEVSLHILALIDDPRTLSRASCVSRFWRTLLTDEWTWKTMCVRHGFGKGMEDAYRAAVGVSWRDLDSLAIALEVGAVIEDASDSDSSRRPSLVAHSHSPAPSIASTSSLAHRPGPLRSFYPSPTSSRFNALRLPTKLEEQFSFKKYFKLAYLTEANWRRGGRVLRSHTSPDDGVVTSVAMSDDWIVAGLVNHKIHVFAADTGAHVRTLVGHTQGVWCLVLVEKGGGPSAATFVKEDGTGMSGLRGTDVNNSSVGWGQASSLVVSGGCDREVRVWDVATGYCLHSLRGHTSTIRCLKVLDGRPIAVSGSRDSTLRVWDIQKGRCLHLLSGHTNSVRCLDVAGNVAVSGSYDCTARMWNVDTGECLRTFEGHYHQIYAVAFDGLRVATGSLDSTVRVWNPETGVCTSMLSGHTSLVGQLQLSGDTLISGGSDGRVIVFSLSPHLPEPSTLHRLCAHDNSVTCLQFDDRFLITGGNDGHVKLFEVKSGLPIRELTEPCDAVWRVAFRGDRCVIMCKRGARTVMEILSFRPPEEAL